MTARTEEKSSAGDANDGHPGWCVRHRCTATPRRGVHRGKPAIIHVPVYGTVSAQLYESSTQAGVLVEVRGVAIVLPANMAKQFGDALAELGSVAELTELDGSA